jgi:hypothetical protein
VLLQRAHLISAIPSGFDNKCGSLDSTKLLVVKQSVETSGFQIMKHPSHLATMLLLLRASVVDVLTAESALSGVLKKKLTVSGVV